MLGFSSGLPLALTDSTLQAWLTVAGVDITTIGLFSLLALPYVLKFLWAPLLDRFRLPWFGRRRGWMAASQLVLVALIIALAAQDPGSNILLFAWFALGLAFVSSTLDIAVDAYRAEILRANERGLGAGLSVAAYKIAMVVSGAGAFVLADRIGFSQTYAAIAALALVGLVATAFAREPAAPPVATPGNLKEAVLQPFLAFFQRRHALALLGVISLYKLGDAAAGRLSIAFFVRELEFSLTEVGAIYKGLGIAASLLGGLLGGALMFRWTLYRSLMVFGVVQALTNFGFLLLAIGGKSYAMMIGVVALENLSGGMGTAALVALLMALCDRRYTATQFALLSAVASLGRIVTGPPAGYFVEGFGWTGFFAATVLVALPSLVLLYTLKRTLDEIDQADSSRRDV